MSVHSDNVSTTTSGSLNGNYDFSNGHYEVIAQTLDTVDNAFELIGSLNASSQLGISKARVERQLIRLESKMSRMVSSDVTIEEGRHNLLLKIHGIIKMQMIIMLFFVLYLLNQTFAWDMHFTSTDSMDALFWINQVRSEPLNALWPALYRY